MTFEEYEKQRKEALGLVSSDSSPSAPPSSSSNGSFESYESSRKMELGLIPDTRTKNLEQKKTDMYFSEDITPIVTNQMEPQQDPGAADSAFRQEQNDNGDFLPGGMFNPINNIVRAAKFVDRSTASMVASLAPKGYDLTSDPNKSLWENISDGPNYVEGPTAYDRAVAHRDTTGNGGWSDHVADITGEAASYVAPLPGMNPILTDAYAGVKALTTATKFGSTTTAAKLAAKAEKRVGQFGKNAADKLNPFLNVNGMNIGPELATNMAQRAAHGATAGAMYGATKPFISGTGDFEEVPGSVAENALMFGAGDVALPLAGALAKGVGERVSGSKIGEYINSFFRKTPEPAPIVEQAGDPLALPLGRRDARINAANERSNLPYGDDVIAPANDIPGNALPQGSYTQPQRLRVSDNAESMLDRVMTQIKPEVEQMIAVPARRDLLVNYIQKYTQVPIKEIHNMPMNSLQELGQYVRQGINLPKLASETAAKYGHDLPALFEGKLPTVKGKIANDANARVAGVYPSELPNVRQPGGFNSSVTGSAAAPLERLQYRPGEMRVTPNKSVRQAAQSLGGEMKRSPVSVPANVESSVNRFTAAPDATNAPVRPTARATKDVVVSEKPRGFAETLKESDKTPQGFKDLVRSGYKPLANKETLATANKRIDADLEEAASFVMGKSRASAEKTAVALRLVDEFNKKGEFARAASIVEKYAPELTQAGQAGQAVAMFEKLSAEGVLLYAQKIANKTNELIPLGVKEVKITPKMAEGIYELSTVTRKMQGVKELSNDVQNILDKAKTGEKLTETEATALKTFVNESKQFIKETTRPPRAPRPPQEPKDKRVRDNVVNFLDAQEAAARQRIKDRGMQVNSLPLDLYADYAIIGAAKMGKGTIKFADWSEAMIKDFGEETRPYLKQLYERSVQTYTQSTKTVSQQTISEAEKIAEKVIANKELTGAQADSIRSLSQKLSRLAGDEKITASQDLQKILQTLERPGILKKISSTQTIGQLLNPKTQVRNAVGNELFYRVERLNKMLATPIDVVRSKITGGDRTVTFKTNNQGEYWKNWMRGVKAGWNGVNINGLQTAYDLGSPAFKGKWNPLTYMEKSLGAALKSFDTAAYMRAYNNTVGEMATLRAINEGKKGNKELIQKYIREADENVMKIADEYGKYVTFQDNNVISKTLVATKRVLNAKQDFGLGDLVLKYPKTPGALLMRALEYSPAGFVRSGMQLARPFFKKEPNTKEATEALTRAMMGTFGFSGMGYFLMDKGIVTGSASKDKDVRDLQKSAGQGQYQVNLSALSRFVKSGFDPSSTKLQEDDYMYTYDWMQPISIAASMGANVAKNIGEGKSKLEGLAGTIYNSAEGGLSTLTEQSVLSGLKSATQLYPGQSVTDKIFDILTDIPSSFIPTYLNQMKQMNDNSKPETFSPDKIERGLNKAKAKIPGLSGQLPKQFDTLGKQKETYQDNNAFNVLLNPGFSSNYELSPEAKYVIDLMNESDDESVAPRVPGKTISVNGQSMQLNGDQFSRLQELQGLAQKKEIGKLRGTGSLKNRVDRDQTALTKAGTDARKQLVKEFPELKPVKAK